MKRQTILFATSWLLFTGSFDAAQADVVVTACNTTVPAGTTATLGADLFCPVGLEAIKLEDGATFALGGFALFGDPDGPNFPAVRCESDCRVVGPGTISGFSHAAIFADQGRMVVRDLTLSANAVGVLADDLRMRRCEVLGSLASGVYANSAAIDASTIRGSGWIGLSGTKVRVSDSRIESNYEGVSGDFVRIQESTVSDNLQSGVLGYRVQVSGGAVSSNGLHGVAATLNPADVDPPRNRLVVKDCSVLSNAGHGVVSAGRLSAVRTSIDGNATGGACPSDWASKACADVASNGPPALRYTTCSTSIGPSGTDWDVCSDDTP